MSALAVIDAGDVGNIQVVNPLRACRLALGLSINGLARNVGVNPQTVIRSEQGVYTNPSQTLVNYFVAQNVMTEDRISRWYTSFQKGQRALAGTRYAPVLLPLIKGRHPFVAWRDSMGLNNNQFCKEFCVHPSAISRFVINYAGMQGLPVQLTDAFADAWYPSIFITHLSQQFRIFVLWQQKTGSLATLKIAEGMANYSNRELLKGQNGTLGKSVSSSSAI